MFDPIKAWSETPMTDAEFEIISKAKTPPYIKELIARNKKLKCTILYTVDGTIKRHDVETTTWGCAGILATEYAFEHQVKILGIVKTSGTDFANTLDQMVVVLNVSAELDANIQHPKSGERLVGGDGLGILPG